MTPSSPRRTLKRWAGRAPLAMELDQRLRPGPGAHPAGYGLERLQAVLPAWRSAVMAARPAGPPAGKLLVIASLRWWVEYCTAVGLLLSAAGYDVDLGTFPYRTWTDPADDYDVRRQNAYLGRVLGSLKGVLRWRDLSRPDGVKIDGGLVESLEHQSLIDVQYTLQKESLDLQPDTPEGRLFALRRSRNLAAARSVRPLLEREHYDAVLIPNGSILEFGAVYRTSRQMDGVAVTFEFGEQRERMWIAHNAEAMRLDTRGLWAARGEASLAPDQVDRLSALNQARRGAASWGTFARRWQAGRSQGALAAAAQLGLDPERPIVLLCTNVVGDSLALDRQVFGAGMAAWLSETVRFMAAHPQAQLVVRIHPGEMRGAGHPSAEIVRESLPEQPAHVLVIPPDSAVNTYDLIELADVGLVYTTTVGMEMAMQGIPVIVAGNTHYRGKGFTIDPPDLPAYLQALAKALAERTRLPEPQVELAWRYAYRFFFEYPFAFPWHLIGFWDDVAARPLPEVVRPDRLEAYRPALQALAGHPIDWSQPR